MTHKTNASPDSDTFTSRVIFSRREQIPALALWLVKERLSPNADFAGKIIIGITILNFALTMIIWYFFVFTRI